MANEQCCANCRYWFQFREFEWDPADGPAPLLEASERNPHTAPDWWCGEWQAREPQTIDEAATVMARQVLAGDASAARPLADRIIELIPLPVVDPAPE